MGVQSDELHNALRLSVFVDLWPLRPARRRYDRHLFADRISARLLHRAGSHALARGLAAVGGHSILDEFPREDLCVDVSVRTEGLLNTVLLHVGVIRTPVDILYTDWAVLIGLVYGYLPFMVLPLYAAIERLNRSAVEAAWDLYANGWSVFWRVVFPLTKSGVIAGCLLVFIPSVGAYITPDLLGGAKTMMVGNLIQHEYLVIRDWPFGSAISFVLMAVVVLGVLAYIKRGGVFEDVEVKAANETAGMAARDQSRQSGLSLWADRYLDRIFI